MDTSSLMSRELHREALVRQAIKGDLEAFNGLVLAYQELIYNQAYRLLGERYAAEDATQTAFISAYKHLKSFRGGSFKAWLLRIVTNTCFDELRRRKAHPLLPFEPLSREDDAYENATWMVDDSLSPEEHVERKELGSVITRSLEQLALPYREVLLLVDIQGLSYAEAAEALGKPVGTVKSRLARGRKLLGEQLKAHWEVLPLRYTAEAAAV